MRSRPLHPAPRAESIPTRKVAARSHNARIYRQEGISAAFEVGEDWAKDSQIDVASLRDDGWTDLETLYRGHPRRRFGMPSKSLPWRVPNTASSAAAVVPIAMSVAFRLRCTIARRTVYLVLFMGRPKPPVPSITAGEDRPVPMRVSIGASHRLSERLRTTG